VTFEVLLCDDGSDDQGLAIAHSFNEPRVICWRDGRRLGLPARLNECIERAGGPYLARMDADHIARPGRLAQQMAFLVDHGDVVDGDLRLEEVQRLKRSPSTGEYPVPVEKIAPMPIDHMLHP
jgi:glycosyltransferase involved in cell wall biosynthesis